MSYFFKYDVIFENNILFYEIQTKMYHIKLDNDIIMLNIIFNFYIIVIYSINIAADLLKKKYIMHGKC